MLPFANELVGTVRAFCIYTIPYPEVRMLEFAFTRNKKRRLPKTISLTDTVGIRMPQWLALKAILFASSSSNVTG